MRKQDSDAIWALTKRVKELEQKIIKVSPKRLEELFDRFDLLMTQLNRHVNPTRDDVLLLKRTNRELAKELLTVHELLNEENRNPKV